MPGRNPTLGGQLVELGETQGVYTHSFATFELDWTHRELPPPSPVTVAGLQGWFAEQDAAMKSALDRFSEEELRVDRIDRGHGFVASPFVQHQVYREAVYLYYGKLSVYLNALETDAVPTGLRSSDNPSSEHQALHGTGLHRSVPVELHPRAGETVDELDENRLRERVRHPDVVAAYGVEHHRRARDHLDAVA
ncbi:hypothetical protein JOD67_002651 [Tenggerimyces flavus]|nr:hypothetical protein [Tenggerimyces flavus]